MMGAPYISDISRIDVQGIVNGDNIRKDYIRQFRSISLHLNLQAKNKLLFEKNQAILKDPELVELNSQVENLSAKKSDSPEHTKEYERAVFKRKWCYNRLQNQSRWCYRQSFFRSAITQEIRRQIEQGEQGIHEPEDENSVELNFVSEFYFPDWHAIAVALWCSSDSYTNDRLNLSAVAHMQKLCEKKPFVLYFQGESPSEGHCPVYQMPMADLTLHNRPKHIHACFEASYKEQATRARLKITVQ